MSLVASSAAWAATSPPGGVAVVVHDARGVYQVHGAFEVAVPLAVAWGVLVDYEHIGTFVRSVRKSEFIRTPAGERLLRQDAIVASFPFRRSVHVELALREFPRTRVEFHDVSGRDFTHYAGAWTLGRDSLGTRIGYALDAEPSRGMPAFLGRGVVARQTHDLLAQVCAEMVARAGPRAAEVDSVRRASPRVRADGR